MNLHWVGRWWTKGVNRLRHPWHSLVSLFAAVGSLILFIVQLLMRAIVWVFRKLGLIMNISLLRVFKGLIYAAIALCLIGVLVTIFLINYPASKVPDYQPIDQHVYLSQGWGWSGGQNEPLRQLFYYTPQGAGLKDLRYSWFVNLEVPWGTTRFADPQRMSAYGFLVDTAPTPLNPDGLPVGFTSHYDSRFGENVLDLTCAACHTGELTVTKRGKRYGLRVDGGPAMHAFTAMHIGDFGPELLGSLLATYLNPFKFARFAQPVLGTGYPQGRWRLHHDLGTVIGNLARQVWSDKTRHLYPTEEGPGRIDALGRIGNTVFGDELSSVNYKISNAPVRYPPLWDIWKFNYVQYNASVRQPMTRNVSESMGVGATTELLNPYGGPIARGERFDTSVRMDNLSELETALWSLEPPKWSEDCMGKIDWDRAKRGRKLFEDSCRHCHGPFPASEPIKEWFAYLKTPGYQAEVIRNWQNFLNSIYGMPNQEQAQLATVPAPSDQNAIGIQLPQHETTTPAGGSGQISFQPLLRPHHEELEEARAHQVQSPFPQVTRTPPQIPANYDFPLWMMHSLPVEDIGTDPTAAVNFVEKKIDVTRLGFRPGVEAEGMRTLLQHDLNDETDAYAKEILRLSGKPDEWPAIHQMSAEKRQALRAQALEVVDKIESQSKATDSAQNDKDEGKDKSELDSDIVLFKDLVYNGPSRVRNFVASMDLSQLNTGVALRMIVFHARMRFYAERRYTDPERDELNGFGELDVPQPLPQYKPRPLAGIWAAGPFLHNGSVPTIYQLLLPADRRDKRFFVGTRDFDPVNLGLSTHSPMHEGFWLDTSIAGNSNVGHEFRKGYIPWKPGSPPQYGVIGPEFTEQERRDLIEYLKIHRDDHNVQIPKDNVPDKDLDLYLREGLDTTNVCQ